MLLAKTIRHWTFVTRFNVRYFTLKSERINGLRKQYDAFLEEDKRRKERNEFILGRLDKMRFYSTALQSRDKPNSLISRSYNQMPYEPEDLLRAHYQMNPTNRPNLPIDLHIKHDLDDAMLLKELSNKYILIPKIPAVFNDRGRDIQAEDIKCKQIIEDNADWKSKYDILDLLKRKDTEDDPRNPIGQKNYSHKLHDGFNELENPQKYETEINNDNNTLKYSHEIPEKDIIKTKVNLDLLEQYDTKEVDSEMHAGLTLEPMKENIKFHTNEESKISETMQALDLNDNTDINKDIHVKSSTEVHKNIDFGNKNDHIVKFEGNGYSEPQLQEVHEKNLNATEENECVTNVPLTDDGDNNMGGDIAYFNSEVIPVEAIAPDDLAKEIINEVKPVITNEFPAEIINAQEFTANEDVKLFDGANVNPGSVVLSSQAPIDITNNPKPDTENIIIQEHGEDVVDATDIEAFNTEQREMFYSDQHEAYDPMADSAYQGGYAENEDFQQNEQYAYYQGQLEQSYPTEVNEHEETSQQYDPHYAQQYGQEGYIHANETQQEVYDQQQYEQNPEQNMNYDQTLEEYTPTQYEQQIHESETLNVEEQLDDEEGFIEKQNEDQTEIQRKELKKREQVADITAS